MDHQEQTGRIEGLVPSPITHTFGIRYLRWGPGWVEAEFEPDASLANHSGYVQGGVLGVYLDNIMGQACYTLMGPEQLLSTAEMSMHFLEPAALGLLRCSARVIKRGRQMLFVEGEVQSDQGKPLVRAVASMLVLRRTRSEVDKAKASKAAAKG